MIKLDVQPYCHECATFEPSLMRLYAGCKVTHHIIICEHQAKCKLIESYLKEKNDESE